jgi:predicted nucleotidyltransferase
MANGFFGTLGDGFAAASDDELRDLLARVEAIVPPRMQGRTRDDRERYCIVHYLRTLERAGLLRFPFKVTKDRRPRFRIEQGSEHLGLEVTEAGSAEIQRAMTELEKAPPGSVLEGSVVRKPGEPLQHPPYVGDEPERLWTADVLQAIRNKTTQLSDYQGLPGYHLLVYDNSEFAVLTAWSVTELPGRLATAIHDWRTHTASEGRHFSRISVLRDWVLMYDVTGTSFVLPLSPSPSLPSLLPLNRLGVTGEDLHAFCRRHRIRKLGFFGSVRDERFGPDSDVDVLVEFEPDVRIGLIRLAGIELELSRLLGRKADLRTVPDLSRYFREEVVREKTDLVYAAG